MAYHVPLHDSWRPSDLVEAFRGLGIRSEVSNQRVSAVIPILKFRGIDEIHAATTPEQRLPKKLGDTTATLSFSSERLIDNIAIDVDFELLVSVDRYPDFMCLTKALEKCGYVSGSELEIFQLYLPDDADAARLTDEIELLDVRKEECIANQDYAGAGEALRKQTLLRMQLEEKIRNRPR